MSDQHLRAASGCYGSREVHTPNIDAIGATGMRFDRAYCPAPVCVPSRGSIITGLHPHQHGALILQDPLPATVPTIAHFFRERGYATGAIGKMHFVDETQRHGFDHRLYLDDFRRALSADDWKRIRKDQGEAGGIEGRPSDLEPRHFQDHYYAEKSVQFLQENRGRPFCLWSSFYMPHTPLSPLRRYFEMYDPGGLSLPAERNAARIALLVRR